MGLHLGELILRSGRKLTVLARDIDRLAKIETLGADIIEGDGLDSKLVEKAIDVAAENGNGKILYVHIFHSCRSYLSCSTSFVPQLT